jgi:hypothetical protein
MRIQCSLGIVDYFQYCSSGSVWYEREFVVLHREGMLISGLYRQMSSIPGL